MSQEEIYDITIIGGGPVGLFAAFYAGIRQAKTKIIDSLPELGGKLQTLYPESYIYDLPGFPKVKAGEFIHQLKNQIQPFEQTICLDEEVLEVEKTEDGYHLRTNRGSHFSKTIIIAIGSGAFQPYRLKVDLAEKYEGKQIHYSIQDIEQFRNQKVLITGGGDSVVDWAMALESVASEVNVLHRRNEFKGNERGNQPLQKSTVSVLTPYQIKELVEEDNRLIGVNIEHLHSNQKEILDCDHIIVNQGYASSLQGAKNWGFEMERNTIKVASDMSTNLPGIYAAGDISTYDGKVKLIATGLGEAPIAVNNALLFIHPDMRKQPVYSSSFFKEK